MKRADHFEGAIPRPQAAAECAEAIYDNQGNPDLLRLRPPEARRILDIGCGTGSNARLLGAEGCRVWGVTVSPREAEIAKRRLEEVSVCDVERDRLPWPKGSFDLLLMSHVLEHLVRPKDALARLAEYLQPGGWLLAAVPNMAHWRIRVRLARGDWAREESGPFDRTHLHFWSFATAPRVVEGTPFASPTIMGGSPAVPLWPLRRLAPAPSRWIDREVGRLRPNLWSTQIFLLAKAIE